MFMKQQPSTRQNQLTATSCSGRTKDAYQEKRRCPTTTTTASCKKVSFCPHSGLHLYTYKEQNERTKSFPYLESKAFRNNEMKDALRIRSLMDLCPYTIGFLIQSKIISPENLLGIETLIMGPEKTMKQHTQHRACHCH
jgi:hypothetical protein